MRLSDGTLLSRVRVDGHASVGERGSISGSRWLLHRSVSYRNLIGEWIVRDMLPVLRHEAGSLKTIALYRLIESTL